METGAGRLSGMQCHAMWDPPRWSTVLSSAPTTGSPWWYPTQSKSSRTFSTAQTTVCQHASVFGKAYRYRAVLATAIGSGFSESTVQRFLTHQMPAPLFNSHQPEVDECCAQVPNHFRIYQVGRNLASPEALQQQPVGLLQLKRPLAVGFPAANTSH